MRTLSVIADEFDRGALSQAEALAELASLYPDMSETLRSYALDRFTPVRDRPGRVAR